MEDIKIKVKKLREEAKLPIVARKDDMGADICACLYDEETGEKITKIVIPAGGKAKIGTGIAIQLPTGYGTLIMPRSSSGIKKGISFQNTTPVIDAAYTGEILLFIKNNKDCSIEIEDGERIAQLVILPIPNRNFIEVDELDETERGDGGFGSTGAK